MDVEEVEDEDAESGELSMEAMISKASCTFCCLSATGACGWTTCTCRIIGSIARLKARVQPSAQRHAPRNVKTLASTA